MMLSEWSASVFIPSSVCIFGFGENIQSARLLKYAAFVCGSYGLEVSDNTENFRDVSALFILLHYYNKLFFDLGDIILANPIEMHLSEKRYELEFSISSLNFELFSSHLQRFWNFPPILILEQEYFVLSLIAVEKEMSFGGPIYFTLWYPFYLLVKQNRKVDVKGEYEFMVQDIRQNVDQVSRSIAEALK